MEQTYHLKREGRRKRGGEREREREREREITRTSKEGIPLLLPPKTSSFLLTVVAV